MKTIIENTSTLNGTWTVFLISSYPILANSGFDQFCDPYLQGFIGSACQAINFSLHDDNRKLSGGGDGGRSKNGSKA
jgi:hypothetical protein